MVMSLFIVLSYLVLLARNSRNARPSATPSPQASRFIPSPIASAAASFQTPETGKDYQIITDEDKQEIDRDNAVGILIGNLPYQGQYSSLRYDIKKNNFVLIVKSNNRTAGNAEVDLFLKNNGILNRDWLYNLVTEEE